MSEVEISKQNFVLESIDETDGKFYVVGKALSKDFECETGMEALSKDILRQPLVWRHRHPIDPKHKDNHVYGRVVESWVDDFLMVKAEIYDHTKDHLAFQEVIKERDNIEDPLSFSMRYRTYFNEDRTEKIHWDVFELSGTPYPACKTCQIENFIGENEMVDETDGKKEPDTKELESAVSKIKELETQLNSKTQVLEDLEGKLKDLEDIAKTKDEELENTKKESSTLEERILELENYTVYLENKKPIISKIKKYRTIDDRELEFYKAQDVSYLSKKLEEAKKDAENKIQTQTLEGSADEARTKAGSLDKELEKNEPSFEEFTKHFRKNRKKET